jgi:hypothetical protein
MADNLDQKEQNTPPKLPHPDTIYWLCKARAIRILQGLGLDVSHLTKNKNE